MKLQYLFNDEKKEENVKELLPKIEWLRKRWTWTRLGNEGRSVGGGRILCYHKRTRRLKVAYPVVEVEETINSRFLSRLKFENPFWL